MFQQQIKKGAVLLDEKIPGWENRIDLETLWLGSECNCIIGQLFSSDFWDELREIVPRGTPFLYDAAHEYGFNVDRQPGVMPDQMDDLFDTLTEEWKQFIQERRERNALFSDDSSVV